jgi:hypothetical protein
MILFLLMLLKETLFTLPFCSQLACSFPLGPSGTTQQFLFIVMLRPVSVIDVFLLSMQSVGTWASLKKTVVCFRILVRLLLVFILLYFCLLSFLCILYLALDCILQTYVS